MASTNYHEVSGVDEFKSLMEADLERTSLLSFWAPWAEPCKQMNEVVKELAKKHESVLVLSVSRLDSGSSGSMNLMIGSDRSRKPV